MENDFKEVIEIISIPHPAMYIGNQRLQKIPTLNELVQEKIEEYINEGL